VGPQGVDKTPHGQPWDFRLHELTGENAGRPGNHGHLVSQAAQLERKFTNMRLRTPEDITPREYLRNPHALPLFGLALGSRVAGEKVSLDGRPYQVESSLQRVRHAAISAWVGTRAA
jgi:hypothetical protein